MGPDYSKGGGFGIPESRVTVIWEEKDSSQCETGIKKSLLESWKDKLPKPQNELLDKILEVISDKGLIDIKTKEKLAQVVREHYTKHKEALKLQASGNSIPKTVSNHK